MNINNYTYYYFVGIGGIGMSALARYFLLQEKKVYGYDKTKTPLTDKLELEGANIEFEDEINTIPATLNSNNTLVIYTPAIKTLGILSYFEDKGFTIYKRSKALAEVTKETKCIAIAGTHGKTTTTTLLAYILKESNFPCMSFLGGISENYNTNFLYGGQEYSLVEADEFDKSFLQLDPYYTCITSIDADHLDIYGDASHFQKTFQEFANKTHKEGHLFLRKGLPIQKENISYAIEEMADYYSDEIQPGLPLATFKFYQADKNNIPFQIPLQGRHNIENATAAIAIAIELGVAEEKIQKILPGFKGIKRRFSTYFTQSGKVYVDDYAHHPTELKAAITAVNNLFPDKKKLFVFQPHLYTRTRDFAQEFASVLGEIEQLIVLDIYPARELPIEGIDSNYLASLIDKKVQLSALDDAMENIFMREFDILVTLGAGNIDTLSEPILKKLNE